MADWYPGAYRVQIGGNGNSITARPAENILHIAASAWNLGDNGHAPDDPWAGIAGWAQTDRACNGYIDARGAMQQYCTVWEAVNGVADGNGRCRTWESQNPEGLTGSDDQYNSSVWTAEQCERFSDLLAWDHVNNGALLQNMGTSLRTAHGVGVHRYGIAPWRVDGGEVWTRHDGKVCPGTARVRQLDSIIERAKVISMSVRNGHSNYLPVGPVHLSTALLRTGTTGGAVDQTGDDDMSAAELKILTDKIDALAKQVEAATGCYSAVNGERYPSRDMARFIDFNVNRVQDIVAATAKHMNVTVPERKASGPKPVVAKPPTPPVKAARKTYKVASGDSLTKIAAEQHVTIEQIVLWNKLPNADAIEIDQVLFVGP